MIPVSCFRKATGKVAFVFIQQNIAPTIRIPMRIVGRGKVPTAVRKPFDCNPSLRSKSGSPKRKPSDSGFPASAADWGDLGSMRNECGKGAQCRIFAWHDNMGRLVSATIHNAGGGFAGEH